MLALNPDPRHLVAFADLVDHLKARDDLTEHRVFAVEVRLWAVADEELGSAGIRGRSLGHGQRTSQVHLTLSGKFILDGKSWSARAVAQRTTTLNHEIVDHAVKDQPVVVGTLHLLPALGIGKFLGSLGQFDKVGHRAWRIVLEEFNDDLTRARFDMCFLHGHTLT